VIFVVTAAVILGLTYVGVALTRFPRVNIDRPSAAFTGAVLMLLFGVLTFRDAVAAIDFDTMALLLGMMMLVAVLNQAGFFTFLAIKAMSLSKTPLGLLVMVVVSTGVLSAFLVNDVVVLLFTPVVICACRMLRANPVPYLIAEAMASNVGSTATIVGNPQNMLIGIASGISFTRFFVCLLPIVVVSTVALLLLVLLFYRKEFNHRFQPDDMGPLRESSRVDYKALRRLMPIVGLTMLAFFLSSYVGVSIPLVALAAGALVILFSSVRPSEVIRNVDWVLLLFFAGLFVVIGGARQAGVLDFFLNRITPTPDVKGIVSIHVVSALASQLVSNVPFTILAIPAIQSMPSDILWLSLAAGSTLGGNITIIGAVANIIMAEGARREGVEVHFGEFLKVGLVVTAVTIALSIATLVVELNLGLVR